MHKKKKKECRTLRTAHVPQNQGHTWTWTSSWVLGRRDLPGSASYSERIQNQKHSQGMKTHLSLWFQTLESVRVTGKSSLHTWIPGPHLQGLCFGRADFSPSLPGCDAAAVCGSHSEMLICSGHVFLGLGKAVGLLQKPEVRD